MASNPSMLVSGNVFEKVIKEQTGCDEIIYNFTTSYNDEQNRPWSYIDHQSVENQEYHYIFENEALLRDFIFNRDSVLETSNDNDY